MKIGHFLPAALGIAALAAAGAAQADALSLPSLSGPLAANASPASFDAGPLGNIYITGAVSGLGLIQSNHSAVPHDNEEIADFSNAQVFIQKPDGMVQFFAQFGGYSLPALGTPYIRATQQTSNSYGVVPVAFGKIVFSDSLNIEAGRLPTLIGAEYTFTFQNLDIERGLLWNQEPAISQGVQANYTTGPWSASISLNDGYFSDRYNWLTGSLAYAVSSADTLTLVGGGNTGHTDYGAPVTGPALANATPLLQNNSSIFNLIWAHTAAPWTITPYFQFQHVPSVLGLPSTDTIGGAVLVNYAFNSNWSLGGRIEYISADNKSSLELYGPGSSAWSVTITPTYQYKVFFARADFSYVGIGSGTPGLEFGVNANKTSQFRGLIEGGILF